MRKHWVIPDIHGCARTLHALIEDNIKPTKHDELYFLGDYIDRGPDSKGVIDMCVKNENYNFIDLDNGVYMDSREGFGNLVALELNSMELAIQHNVE